MSPTLWHLFVAFGRSNLLGYGGGPGLIPLIEVEVVQTYGWLTKAEFAKALAIGNTLPGPIATKMAAYIGYQVAGVTGSVVALLATILPTAAAMIVLAAVLLRYADSPVIKGMIRGVMPVIFVLLLLLALDFLPALNPRAGLLPPLIAVGAFVAIYFFGVHQAAVVAAAIVVGATVLR